MKRRFLFVVLLEFVTVLYASSAVVVESNGIVQVDGQTTKRNIVAVCSYHRSHNAPVLAIVSELSNQGHNVTLLFPEEYVHDPTK